jgi:flagellar protein FliO/FliZ
MDPNASYPGFSALLWLILILVMIPVALRLLRGTAWGGMGGLGNLKGLSKLGLGGSATPAPLQVVSTLPIGPGQRLVTVEVRDGLEPRRLLLGVTAQGITLLQSEPLA